MVEKEALSTTPIDRFYNTGTTYTGTYIVDRIKSNVSTMIGELGIMINKCETLMKNCDVLTKKESFTLSQYHQAHIEQIINELQESIRNLGESVSKWDVGVNDWKFTNDLRALQLSVDDVAQSIMAAANNTRFVAADYNWRKFVFILRDMDVSEDIIKTIDDARRKHTLKSGRRKGEHQDPFAQTRKWLKKILNGYKMVCPQCKFEIRDHSLIEYIEPDKSSRHAEANNP